MGIEISNSQKEKYESFLKTHPDVPSNAQLDLMLDYMNAAMDHDSTKMDEIYTGMENNTLCFLYDMIWFVRSDCLN